MKQNLAGGISQICLYKSVDSACDPTCISDIVVSYTDLDINSKPWTTQRQSQNKSFGQEDSKSCLSLSEGEFIVKINIWRWNRIDALELLTNRNRRLAKFGGNGGSATFWEAPSGMHLLALYGHSWSQIDKLGFYYGTVSPTGTWASVASCVGCSSNTFKIESCTKRTDGQDVTVSDSWSRSVKTEVSLGFKFEGISATAGRSVTSTQAGSIVSRTSKSFETSLCQTQTMECTARLWQWTMGTWAGSPEQRSINTDLYVCSYEQPCCLPGYFKDNRPDLYPEVCQGNAPSICASASLERMKSLSI